MHQQNTSNVFLSCHPSLQKPTGLYVFLNVSMCPNFHFVYAQIVSKPANYLPCSCLCLPVTVWKSPRCLLGFILKCSCSCHNLVFKKVGGGKKCCSTILMAEHFTPCSNPALGPATWGSNLYRSAERVPTIHMEHIRVSKICWKWKL